MVVLVGLAIAYVVVMLAMFAHAYFTLPDA
jgi:hypothetical protein